MATKEALTGPRLTRVLEALEGNWQAEMEGYHTYQTLADRERCADCREQMDAECARTHERRRRQAG